MEMPIGEAQARILEAIAAMERGERVVVTRDGEAIADIVPSPRRAGGIDFDKADRLRKEPGLDKFKDVDVWPPELTIPHSAVGFSASKIEAPTRHACCDLVRTGQGTPSSR